MGIEFCSPVRFELPLPKKLADLFDPIRATGPVADTREQQEIMIDGTNSDWRMLRSVSMEQVRLFKIPSLVGLPV